MPAVIERCGAPGRAQLEGGLLQNQSISTRKAFLRFASCSSVTGEKLSDGSHSASMPMHL